MPPPRQGLLFGWQPVQPLGDGLALQPGPPGISSHLHCGLLYLLRVPLPPPFPAGSRLLRRGGEADGFGVHASRLQDSRCRDGHPSGADVPRSSPHVVPHETVPQTQIDKRTQSPMPEREIEVERSAFLTATTNFNLNGFLYLFL